MTYDPEVVNDLALVPLLVGMLFAACTGLIYGATTRWHESLLGVALFSVMVTTALPLVLIVARRIAGRYPGYEWVALILFTLFAFAWGAMLAIVIVERKRALGTVKRGTIMATQEVKADARQRSIRTLLQGLAVDVLVALGAALLAVLGTISDDELFTAGAWIVVATAVAKSVLTALASFLARLALPPAEH